MRSRRGDSVRTFLPLCVALSAAGLVAQEANQGTITGFVYDQSQSLVSAAEIRVISQATGQTREVKSGADGVYTVVALQPGVYTVRASAKGFKNAEAKDVQLSVGASLRL